ncbi:MAG: four helix bundle protein [Bacteroidales bacterium]|nr:four helix bundle protein [Bacteroidales bacterium]
MTKQEILTSEQAQHGIIALRKDGLFWRAYEQSAYLLKNHFWSDLKVNGGHVKAVKQDMYYVGFPEKSLQERILDKLPEVEGSSIIEQTEKKIIIGCPHIDGFEEWKQSLTNLHEQATEKMQPFYGKLPLYKAVYDLYFKIVNLTRHFPKDVQYTVGDKLINYGLELNTLLYRLLKINKAQTKERQFDAEIQKESIINEIDEMIEQVRFLLRVSYDLKLYNVENFASISETLESIRKQLYGWQRSNS